MIGREWIGRESPPTFLFAAELDSGAAGRLLDELGVPVVRVLYGEQGFAYHRTARVGGTIGVDAVAFGLIQTRLTHATAEEETADIGGKEIKLGVNPGLLKAMEQMIPLGHGGRPEEAAGAVYLLCIPESDYVSGQVLMCTGGLTGI